MLTRGGGDGDVCAGVVGGRGSDRGASMIKIAVTGSSHSSLRRQVQPISSCRTQREPPSLPIRKQKSGCSTWPQPTLDQFWFSVPENGTRTTNKYKYVFLLQGWWFSGYGNQDQGKTGPAHRITSRRHVRRGQTP